MASNSSFLVYFEGQTTIDNAEHRLRATTMKITRNGNELVARWKNGPELYVGINENDWVKLEAREVAEAHDIAELATCHRRFEVAFDDLDKVLDETNTMFEVGAILQDLTQGYILYSWNGNVLLPDGKPCTCGDCQ
jgi:hypothetical protein